MRPPGPGRDPRPGGDTGPGDSGRATATGAFTPEYASPIREVLLVYDQVATGHFFEEALQVIDNLPPRVKVYFLASRGRSEEARSLLDRLDRRSFEVIEAPDERLWGDWGRDIFMLGWRGGRRAALVPFNKRARSRGELTRGYEILKRLRRPRIDVYLAPVSFEGGNLCYDLVDGERVLFVGNSALLETAALYAFWFAKSIDPAEVQELFRRNFQVDRVVPLGRQRGGRPIRQASFTFHIDMAMTIPARGLAVVAAFDHSTADTDEIQSEFSRELDYWLGSSARRAELEELLDRKGIKVRPPQGRRELGEFLRACLDRELRDLAEAASEMEAIAATLEELGYRVHRIPTDWRRVRKYQAYTNVLPSADRLIMPIFPKRELTYARSVPLPTGRIMVTIVPGEGRNEYALEGLNLEAYRFYERLVGGVRVVEDYFYLACGNVHCIVGRLG